MYYLTLTDHHGEYLLYTAATFEAVARRAHHLRRQRPGSNLQVKCWPADLPGSPFSQQQSGTSGPAPS